MGDPVGDEYPAGDPCGWCWGLGKPYGDVDTPKDVFLTWSGLPAPYIAANKTWKATQDPVHPCLWYWSDGIFQGYWNYQEFFTIAFIREFGAPGGQDAFGGVCSMECTAAPAIKCTIS